MDIFFYENAIYTAVPASYEFIWNRPYYTILLSKWLQSISRIKNCDGSLHILDLLTVASAMAFLLPVPRILAGI